MEIFGYSNYREFLRFYISNLPKGGRGEKGRMARHLGISSAFFSQTISGNKHFSPEQAEGLASYLGLSPLEVDFFILLVQHSRAGTLALRRHYEAKLEDIRAKALSLSNRVETEREMNEQEYAEFYSSHLYAAIWLFTSLGESGKNLEEICTRFEISKKLAGKILRFLRKARLCIESKGTYTMGPQSTHLEQGSSHLLHHYRNWRIQAIQRSETLDAKELMYTAAVSLSKKDFQRFRGRLVEFIQDFSKEVVPSKAEELACLNLDFIWIKK